LKIERFKEKHREGYSLLLKDAFDVVLKAETVKMLSDSQDYFALVAVDEADAVCGGMIAEYRKDCMTNVTSYFLTYVTVKQDMRHKGIGRELFREIERMAEERNVAHIEFTCADFRKESHKFYEAIGYSRKKTKVFIKERKDYGKGN
jgi:GNAT superfamily N-acetyltransferase